MTEVPAALADLTSQFGRVFGRDRSPLLQPYRLDDADTVVVSSGSVGGTLADVIDELRDDGHRVGSVSVTLYRPFPTGQLRDVLSGARRVVIVDRAVAAGGTGFLFADAGPAIPAGAIATDVIAGLGGRPVTREALRDHLLATLRDQTPPMTFLDLRVAQAAAVTE